jgi:hypothetical protein
MDKIPPNFLDTDSLRKAVEKILASSKLQPPETFIEMLYREMTGERKREAGILAAFEKHGSPTPKSITAIKTIEQLLGVPPAKVNIKTNLKDARFSKGSQKTHKQHKQFSR